MSPVPDNSAEPTVDVDVPRFNQAVVALVTGLAFVIGRPGLVAAMFAILAISVVFGPSAAPLTQLYVRIVRPRLRPDGPVEWEPAAPPRFAQTLGALFLGAATVAFGAGLVGLGWALTLLVTALAALAASTRICVGCMIYRAVER